MIEVQVDTSQVLGPVRQQGQRATCLAFTASDLNAAANATPHLSVEFLCHHAAREMSTWTAGEGFTVESILNAAQCPGQPLEELYPYIVNHLAAPPQTPPPGLSPLYRSPSQRRGLTVQEVLDEVLGDRAVGVIVAVTRTLFQPVQGIVEFSPLVLPDQYHAMVAVGSGHHRSSGEPHLLLRNSWGTSWGNNGHAWFSLSYLNSHLVEGVVF